jgi:hypothetical protein
MVYACEMAMPCQPGLQGHEAQHGAPMATPTPLPGHEASPAAHGPGQVLEAAAGEAPAGELSVRRVPQHAVKRSTQSAC